MTLNPGHGMEILLVEDSPSDVRLLREALNEADGDHRLHVAKDGVAAMAYLRRGPGATALGRPSLILLDLNLPRKSGREVLAEVKDDPDLRAIPVVVLTSSQAEEDVKAAYDLHANCYVIKPADLDTYFDAIRMIDHFWLHTAQLPIPA